MTKPKTRKNEDYYDSLRGRMELSDTANKILENHTPADRNWNPSCETLKARRDSLRAEAVKQGIDVVLVYGSRADFSSVVWATGYKTPLTEVAVAMGRNGEDAFIADPELYRTVDEFSRRRNLDMESRAMQSMGLTDELYTFVQWSNFRDVFRLLSGKGKHDKIKVAIATPNSSITKGFVDTIQGVSGIELVLDDGNMIAPLMFNKDDDAITAAHSAAYIAGVSCDVMLGCLRPGVSLSSVVGEGYRAMHMMGCDDFDWPILGGVGLQNQAVITKLAKEMVVKEGDWVTLGVSPHYGGISGVERFTVKVGGKLTDFELDVYNHIQKAFNAARDKLLEVAVTDDQMRLVDSAFREYLSGVGVRSPDTGELVNLGTLIAYSGAHDLGALECGNPHKFGVTGAAQPFSLHHAVDKQLMGLDIAIRGYRESPSQPLLGDLHYVMIERTAIIEDGDVTIPSVVPVDIEGLRKWCGNANRLEKGAKGRNAPAYYQKFEY